MLNLFALKTEVKNLAIASRIIRAQELKCKVERRTYMLNRLCYIRRILLRAEARDTHIAYGYLKGRTYRQIEDNPETEPDWEHVARMVKKYGADDVIGTLEIWRKEQTITVVTLTAA